MKVRALTNFSGAVSMSAGEVRNIADGVIVNDLVNAGYVEVVTMPGESVEQQGETMDSEPVTQQETVSDEQPENDNVSKNDTGKKASKRSTKKNETESDNEG